MWRIERDLWIDLLRLGSPVVLAMLTQTGINLLDTIMVGRLPKQYSIAGQSAIGYSLILLWGVGGFLSALQIGTQSITARRFGEKAWNEAGRIMSNSLVLTIGTSVIAAVVMYMFIESIFPFFNTDPGVLALGIPYAKWRMLGIFPMVAVVSYKGFFDGIGFTKAHMFAAILMNILNVVLNFVFIFGFGPIEPMYVEGAGVASTISSTIGLLLMVAISFWPKYLKKYHYYGLKTLDFRALKEISRLSIPYGFATLFMMAGFGIFLKIVGMVDQQIIEASISSLGFWRPEELPSLRALGGHPFLGDLQLHVVGARPPVYVAAAKVIIDLMSVCFMTCLAFGTGTATFVSQSLGAKKPELAQRYIVESLKIGVLAMVVIGGVCIASPESLFMVFSRDLEVIAAGRTSLQLMGGSMVFAALALVTAQALSGAGNTEFVAKVEGVLMIAWLIPTAYIFGMVLELGLFGIWTSVALYMVLMAVAMLWKFFKGDWKEIEL